MSFRRFPRKRSFNRLGTQINSNKNVRDTLTALAASTNDVNVVAKAVDSAANLTTNEVTRGCKIYRIWLEFWCYSNITGDTNALFNIEFGKSPGNNITLPNPGTVGSSNEKRNIFKEWKGLVGQRSLGGLPYTWKGWLKIPKSMQRMAIDDQFQFVIRAEGGTGNYCLKALYKWFI